MSQVVTVMWSQVVVTIVFTGIPCLQAVCRPEAAAERRARRTSASPRASPGSARSGTPSSAPSPPEASNRSVSQFPEIEPPFPEKSGRKVPTAGFISRKGKFQILSLSEFPGIIPHDPNVFFPVFSPFPEIGSPQGGQSCKNMGT